MRVALFHNLPSGGAKRCAYEWMKRMAREHAVDLFLYDEAAERFLDLRPFAAHTEVVGGAAPLGGDGWCARWSALWHARHASRTLAQRIDAGGYDVVLVLQCRVSNTPRLLRHLRTPSVYYCQEPYARVLEPQVGARDGRLAPLKWVVRRWLVAADAATARKASLICANSLYSRESIYRAYGVSPRLNRLGVDAEQFRPLGAPRERVVLVVGSLSPNKAPDFVLHSVATLPSPPRIRFVHNAGSAAYRSCLADLAGRLGVLVSFDCLISEPGLVRAYNEASLTAVANILEPFGLVALESLACGTPVVGVAEAGIRETVQDGVTGILTERDPREFARAIQRLLGDASLRCRMGEAGRHAVLRDWTWDSSYEALMGHLRRVARRETAVPAEPRAARAVAR